MIKEFVIPYLMRDPGLNFEFSKKKILDPRVKPEDDTIR